MPWIIRVNIEDGEGHVAPVEVRYSDFQGDGTTPVVYADLTNAATALVSGIDGMTLGRIVSREIINLAPVSGTAADPHADVEMKAAFSFRAAPTEGNLRGKISRISVPAIDKNLIVIGGTDRVNTALASVVAFVDSVTDNAPLVAIDTSGSTLVTLESAKEAFGKKRRTNPLSL